MNCCLASPPSLLLEKFSSLFRNPITRSLWYEDPIRRDHLCRSRARPRRCGADVSKVGGMSDLGLRLSSRSVSFLRWPSQKLSRHSDWADRTDFLAGQYFDIRLEVHAPVNGSEANGGVPDDRFTFTIAKDRGKAVDAAKYFDVAAPKIERWNFTWYEDLFAQDAKKPSVVNVAAQIYRRVALYKPGHYVATLTYYDGSKTVAEWLVRPLAEVKRAKNVVLFIGDGMTTNMITAARLIGHQSINGRYKTKLAMDGFPVLGHQMVGGINKVHLRH